MAPGAPRILSKSLHYRCRLCVAQYFLSVDYAGQTERVACLLLTQIGSPLPCHRTSGMPVVNTDRITPTMPPTRYVQQCTCIAVWVHLALKHALLYGSGVAHDLPPSATRWWLYHESDHTEEIPQPRFGSRKHAEASQTRTTDTTARTTCTTSSRTSVVSSLSALAVAFNADVATPRLTLMWLLADNKPTDPAGTTNARPSWATHARVSNRAHIIVSVPVLCDFPFGLPSAFLLLL